MDTNLFFNHYFNNARQNCILIMDSNGIMMDVNKAFTDNFAYKSTDLIGRNFSMLFTQADRAANKPQRELQAVIADGCAADENYLVDKSGNEFWVTGEAILVVNEKGEKFIVKDVINLQSKKQLHSLLFQRDELLERLSRSSKEMCILVLDATMKIVSMNEGFLRLFEINNPLPTGNSLSSLNHPFWERADVKDQMRNVIVKGDQAATREFLLSTRSDQKKLIRLDTKITSSDSGMERKIYVVIEDITPEGL